MAERRFSWQTNCPACAAAVPSTAMACVQCGAPLPTASDASTDDSTRERARLPLPPMVLAVSADTFGSPLAATWILVGCAALAVGSFLPWAEVGSLSADGIDGDGWLTLALAAVIAVIALPLLRTSLGQLGSAVVVFATLAAVYILLDDAAHADSLVDAPRGVEVELGIGMYVAVGGTSAILVGVVLASRRRALFARPPRSH